MNIGTSSENRKKYFFPTYNTHAALRAKAIRRSCWDTTHTISYSGDQTSTAETSLLNKASPSDLAGYNTYKGSLLGHNPRTPTYRPLYSFVSPAPQAPLPKRSRSRVARVDSNEKLLPSLIELLSSLTGLVKGMQDEGYYRAKKRRSSKQTKKANKPNRANKPNTSKKVKTGKSLKRRMQNLN